MTTVKIDRGVLRPAASGSAGVVAPGAIARGRGPRHPVSGGAARPGRDVPAPSRLVDVVLVDDHVLMRQGLCALLRGEQGVRVVAQAGTPAGATAAVMRHQSAVVILDIRLGDDQDEGLRLCRELIEAAPGIRILVLTDELTGSLMRAALHAGAHGVLLKSSDFASLRRAIVDLDAGRNAFDHKTAAIVVGLLRSERMAPMITRRERDILALVARGLTNRAIGEKLAIRDTTVKFHLSNVMRKTGTSSRAGAVFKAGQLGLI